MINQKKKSFDMQASRLLHNSLLVVVLERLLHEILENVSVLFT